MILNYQCMYFADLFAVSQSLNHLLYGLKAKNPSTMQSENRRKRNWIEMMLFNALRNEPVVSKDGVRMFILNGYGLNVTTRTVIIRTITTGPPRLPHPVVFPRLWVNSLSKRKFLHLWLLIWEQTSSILGGQLYRWWDQFSTPTSTARPELVSIY